MKDVTNRKLFRKSAARDRLRQMGGIMSSSPELMGTVQKFSVGSGPMGVQAPPTLADLFGGPKVDRPEIDNPFSLPDFSSDPYMRNPGRVIENYLFPETRVRDVSAAENVGATGQTRIPPRRPEFVEYEDENEIVASTTPPAPPATSAATAEVNENEILMPPAPASSPQTDEELAADARDSAPVVPQRRTEKPDPSASLPDPQVDRYGVEELQKAGKKIRDQYVAFLRDPNATEVEKNDAALEATGKKAPDQKLSLKERAAANAEMYREIMGRDPEEDKKVDGYNLAMLGFLIASGDSPNALQNIARGAAAGVKNFQDTAQARQAREEKIKMAGLEKAIRDDETAKKVEVEERRIRNGYKHDMFMEQIRGNREEVQLATRLGFEELKLNAQLQTQLDIARDNTRSADERARANRQATILGSLIQNFGAVGTLAFSRSGEDVEAFSDQVNTIINSPELMEQVEDLAAVANIGKVTSKDPLSVGRQVQELSTGTDAVRFQQLAEDQFAEAGVRDPSSTQVANLAQGLIKLNAEGKPLTSLPTVGSQQEIEGKMYTVTGFNSQGQPLYEPVGG